jgi:membrane-associated phospholipid phosphatase
MKKTLFISILFASINVTAQNFDINILKPINKTENAFKTSYAKFNSNLVVPFAIGLPAYIAVKGFIENDNALKKDALFITASYVGTGAVTYLIKHTAKRKRPYQNYNYIVRRVNADDNVSFPSGHTSLAFTTATNIALRYKKWYYVAPAYISAGGAAWARMYQGMHYPTDVLAGAAIGTVSAWINYHAQKKWFVKKQQSAKPNTSL